jgi:hypothetical protein
MTANQADIEYLVIFSPGPSWRGRGLFNVNENFRKSIHARTEYLFRNVFSECRVETWGQASRGRDVRCRTPPGTPMVRRFDRADSPVRRDSASAQVSFGMPPQRAEQPLPETASGGIGSPAQDGLDKTRRIQHNL